MHVNKMAISYESLLSKIISTCCHRGTPVTSDRISQNLISRFYNMSFVICPYIETKTCRIRNYINIVATVTQ